MGDSTKLNKMVEELGFAVVHRPADYDEVVIKAASVNRAGIQLTGFLEYFDSDRVQLIGRLEMAYLQQFTAEERLEKFRALFARDIPVLICCHGIDILPECVEAARERGVALLSTERRTSDTIVRLVTYLKDRLAPTITRHGVLVEVYGEGVFITGESGLGKSEAALELVKRGHRLISDDAVEIKKTNDTTLVGSAPELIRNFIEIRGIGIVDVRQIFGASSVKRSERIDLVVALETWSEGTEYDRVGAETRYTELLGVKVPENRVPVRPGRNLAVIIEVAAMNNKQKRAGHNSGQEFNDRVESFFDNREKD